VAGSITSRHLRPLLRAAGLPATRFNDLRHTIATRQLAAVWVLAFGFAGAVAYTRRPRTSPA